MTDAKSIVVTGGAGFIGVNAAAHYAKQDYDVIVLDNLSRKGSENNLIWLKERYEIVFEHVDIRDSKKIDDAINKYRPDIVLHLAGQVAVTTSVRNPREDFETNALGSFNVLEAVREYSPESVYINASTNKVYGKMADVPVHEAETRYEYSHGFNGVDASRPIDLVSPYGCSKGAADLYTIDYHRIYGLNTVTLRQSCIYGPRQCGIEDQGWVAWFAIAAILNHPITIYGDGKQVRDILHIDDLLSAYDAVIAHADTMAGKAFNIGGGMSKTLSLQELIDYLQGTLRKKLVVSYQPARPGDQKIYVTDIESAVSTLSWSPKIDVFEGIESLLDWIVKNKNLFSTA